MTCPKSPGAQLPSQRWQSPCHIHGAGCPLTLWDTDKPWHTGRVLPSPTCMGQRGPGSWLLLRGVGPLGEEGTLCAKQPAGPWECRMS